MTHQAKASSSCWEQLYKGLIDEFKQLTNEEQGTYKISSRYFNAIGYSFGRYKVQEKKLNG